MHVYITKYTVHLQGSKSHKSTKMHLALDVFLKLKMHLNSLSAGAPVWTP